LGFAGGGLEAFPFLATLARPLKAAFAFGFSAGLFFTLRLLLGFPMRFPKCSRFSPRPQIPRRLQARIGARI
jgi:hypothetical protein